MNEWIYAQHSNTQFFKILIYILNTKVGWEKIWLWSNFSQWFFFKIKLCVSKGGKEGIIPRLQFVVFFSSVGLCIIFPALEFHLPTTHLGHKNSFGALTVPVSWLLIICSAPPSNRFGLSISSKSCMMPFLEKYANIWMCRTCSNSEVFLGFSPRVNKPTTKRDQVSCLSLTLKVHFSKKGFTV